jgi:hypothetical protein
VAVFVYGEKMHQNTFRSGGGGGDGGLWFYPETRMYYDLYVEERVILFQNGMHINVVRVYMTSHYNPQFVQQNSRPLPIMCFQNNIMKMPVMYEDEMCIMYFFDKFKNVLNMSQKWSDVNVPGLDLSGDKRFGMISLKDAYKSLVDKHSYVNDALYKYFYENVFFVYDAIIEKKELEPLRSTFSVMFSSIIPVPFNFRNKSLNIIIHKDICTILACKILKEMHNGNKFGEHLYMGKNAIIELFVDNIYEGVGVIEVNNIISELKKDYPEKQILHDRCSNWAVQMLLSNNLNLLQDQIIVNCDDQMYGVSVKHPNFIKMISNGYENFPNIVKSINGIITHISQLVNQNNIDAMKSHLNIESLLYFRAVCNIFNIRLSSNDECIPLTAYPLQDKSKIIKVIGHENYYLSFAPFCNIYEGEMKSIPLFDKVFSLIPVNMQKQYYSAFTTYVDISLNNLANDLQSSTEWLFPFTRHYVKYYGSSKSNPYSKEMLLHVARNITTYFVKIQNNMEILLKQTQNIYNNENNTPEIIHNNYTQESLYKNNIEDLCWK